MRRIHLQAFLGVTQLKSLENLSTDFLVNAEVDGLIESLFVVEERFLDGETPNFIVSQKTKGDKQLVLKAAFRSLADKLRQRGYLAEFRWIVGRYYVTLTLKSSEKKRSSTRNRLLFAATVATVFLDGYLRSNNPVLTQSLMQWTPVFLNALVFTLGIVVVFGVHEMGHKLVSEKRGIRASWPFFIPAPPGLGGTFGAVISQDEPPTNRDDLFDLGIAGPFFGFLASIVIGVVGLWLSFTVPVDQVANWAMAYPEIRFQQIPMPIIMQIISDTIRPTTKENVLVLHPLAFAAWVGFLVTFVNLIPSWQLDGGHIIRALFGRETHKIISIAGVFLLMISGYVIMAVIIAFFLMQEGTESMTPLDDVSPTSLSRKLGLIGYVVLMGLSLIALIQT
jgi:membrane-associated protease RseP (regulator of RpoE activity)